jgi:uncharacterized protein YbjT (DUF2867 family)
VNDPTKTHRAIVFGATGYTGSFLVKRLRELGVETHAHLRPSSSKKERLSGLFQELGANVILEPWEEPRIESIIAELRPTLVFAVLGTTRARMKAIRRRGDDKMTGGYEAVDYGLTAMVHRACERVDGSMRFVYLSSMGVKEGARMPYLSVRWRMEEELRQGGTDWTIVQPGFITGSDREEFRLGERVAARLSDGLLALTGAVGARGLRQKYRSITGQQLAEGMVRWALADEGRNRVVSTMDLGEAV